MAKQWSAEFIDIADDDTDDYYDSQDIKPVVTPKNLSGLLQYHHDDDYFPDDPRRSLLYWTTDATKALIKLRGEREPDFEQGGASKSLLWVEIVRKMRSLGYDFSAEKISKKWHNIMITYNKNIRKKNQTGYVNWEFFEDIDFYYKHKREQDPNSNNINSTYTSDMLSSPTAAITATSQVLKRKCEQEEISYFPVKKSINKSLMNQHSRMIADASVDESEQFRNLQYNIENLACELDTDEMDSRWFKDYLDKRFELEKEKLKREHDQHKDWMNFQKMTLMLQEKVEKIKVDAINNLTNAIVKLAETKMKK